MVHVQHPHMYMSPDVPEWTSVWIYGGPAESECMQTNPFVYSGCPGTIYKVQTEP